MEINLSGVPETMLWPLYNRGCEQRRTDRLIEDPMALELMERIDYDYAGNFGKFNAGHPLRSRVFDDAISTWLECNPNGTIVSLGEGLDTQFWRIDNGRLNWISVDLPEAIDVRNRFLPQHERVKNIACSALDFTWMKLIPKDKPIFIVLAGVIMYFSGTDAKALIAQISDHFRKGEIIFDMIPEWYSRKTMKGMQVTRSYQAPPMPWGMNYIDRMKLLEIHDSLLIKQSYSFADLFPKRMRPFSYFRHFKWVKNNMAPWMIHLKIHH
ncbi:MAG: class I SAM-dependent methyltransferase [Bacteroidales bacterium]|nr:class I SAM-dependent methyltransferase [Bacteroidales bacterium]